MLPDALPDTRDRAGRLTADAVFPAGWPDHSVRRVALAGDPEHVRVVQCLPAATAMQPHAPVLCLHGWGASAYAYHRILAPLGHAGVDAHAADLRGHGWSDKPLDVACYTPGALAEWTLRLLDALALERAVLVGHSLGGAVALQTACRAPERVAALVLLAPVGLGMVARIRQLRRATPDRIARALPRLAAARPITALALRSSYGQLGRPTSRDVDEYWAPSADPNFARAARLVVHADPWESFSPDALAGIAQPVEIVLGERDNLLPVAPVTRLAGAFPRAAVDVVRGAGHVLAEEVPDRVLAAVGRAVDAANPIRPTAAPIARA